jgi:hypothetical protein
VRDEGVGSKVADSMPEALARVRDEDAMKVYRVELMVIDFDGLGEQGIVEVIENARYPNRCISPDVKAIDGREIGAWSDDHPINIDSDAEYRRLFT